MIRHQFDIVDIDNPPYIGHDVMILITIKIKKEGYTSNKVVIYLFYWKYHEDKTIHLKQTNKHSSFLNL